MPENGRRSVAWCFLAVWAAGALLAPLLAPYPYAETHLASRLEGPSARFPLGTDDLGRDVLSRALYGARVSLAVTALSLALALIVGTATGILSGYLGGAVDLLAGRLIDILLALPGILLAITLVAYVGRGFAPLVLALSCTAWVGYARVARSLALSLREREFVLSSLASGGGTLHVAVRHLLPQTVPVLAAQAAAGGAGVLLSEAGLSFLGLGVQPPHPSWGEMLAAGCDALLEAPHLAIVPGLLIFMAVWALNVLGEELPGDLAPHRSPRVVAV